MMNYLTSSARNAANIKVAEYVTQYLPADLLKQKLHQFALSSKQLLEHLHDKQP